MTSVYQLLCELPFSDKLLSPLPFPNAFIDISPTSPQHSCREWKHNCLSAGFLFSPDHPGGPSLHVSQLASHPLTPFHLVSPLVCWVWGFFLATLPEMFSSAGKNVGVLLRRFLGCLPGRIFSISHSAHGEGRELTSPREGEELAARAERVEEGFSGVRGRRTRVCHQPLPASLADACQPHREQRSS